MSRRVSPWARAPFDPAVRSSTLSTDSPLSFDGHASAGSERRDLWSEDGRGVRRFCAVWGVFPASKVAALGMELARIGIDAMVKGELALRGLSSYFPLRGLLSNSTPTLCPFHSLLDPRAGPRRSRARSRRRDGESPAHSGSPRLCVAPNAGTPLLASEGA